MNHHQQQLQLYPWRMVEIQSEEVIKTTHDHDHFFVYVAEEYIGLFKRLNCEDHSFIAIKSSRHRRRKYHKVYHCSSEIILLQFLHHFIPRHFHTFFVECQEWSRLCKEVQNPSAPNVFCDECPTHPQHPLREIHYLQFTMPKYECITVHTFLDQLLSLDNIKNEVLLEFIDQYLFQCIFMLAIFQRYMPGFRHNDYHVGNVLIQSFSEPVLLHFQYDDSLSFRIRTHFQIMILDFGLSQWGDHVLPDFICKQYFEHCGLGHLDTDNQDQGYYDLYRMINSFQLCLREIKRCGRHFSEQRLTPLIERVDLYAREIDALKVRKANKDPRYVFRPYCPPGKSPEELLHSLPFFSSFVSGLQKEDTHSSTT